LYAPNSRFGRDRDTGLPNVPTVFIGHSQGTINGNLAITDMLDTNNPGSEKFVDQIRLINIGTASTVLPQGLHSFVNIIDRRDLVSWGTSARIINHSDTFRAMNEMRAGSAKVIETNFSRDGIQDMHGNAATGNYHSWSLYLARPELQHELRLFDVSMRAPW
jgi:hypothetical protein